MVHIYHRAVLRDCSTIIAKAPVQSTKMRTEYFMQLSKALKATRRSMSLKAKFTNLQGITGPASSIQSFHGQLLLSRP